MKTIHNLATQRSVQYQLNESRSHYKPHQDFAYPHRNSSLQQQHNLDQDHTHSQSQSQSQFHFQRQFSFNRQIRIPNSQGDSQSLKQKYSDIFNDLKIMEQMDVIDLLLEQLEQNEKCKKQIFKVTNRIQALQQQNSEFKEIIKKKRQAIQLLCETQSKNLQLIQKLENKISKKNQYGRDTHYQKKYQQLSVYMNEYIRSINQAQEQFKRAYSNLKAENGRLLTQTERMNGEYDQLFKRYQVLSQRVKRYEFEISQLGETKTKLSSNLNILSEQNQILKKQIQIFQENIRITDRLQIHVEKERHQLSSELDFIRQKICENQNISRDIIEKLEQSSSDCEKVSKQKQRFFQSLQRQKQKTQALEKENSGLKKRNQELEQDIKILRKQLEFLNSERDELDEDLMQEKLEKQSIRKQLLILADKVRLMESTYRKQIEQSEKIKGQLYKYWQTKQKKQNLKQTAHGSTNAKALSEIKSSNQNSQTTLSISQKQSKLSLWNKKSDYQMNISIIQEKQNNQNFSHDSLCS